MENMQKILEKHSTIYPDMQPQDVVKLIYQSEFGGGHIISDEASSLENLKKEFLNVSYDEKTPICEDIGKDVCRLNLSSFNSDSVLLSTINRIFVLSSVKKHGDIASFKEKLDTLRMLADLNIFLFSPHSLYEYLDEYEKAGYPVVSHSAIYRKKYRPAYRVILKKYMRYYDLFAKIDCLLKIKKRVVIAIDGNSGSGKSYLAKLLKDIYDCNVISMDDFFLPKSLRTECRLNEIGGNIHYERFVDEVVLKLNSSSSFKYHVFDCSKMDYGSLINVEPKPLTIIEGSYSLHPMYSNIYDIKVFKTCSAKLQDKRIFNRNGPQAQKIFLEKWIPMENRYFEAFKIREDCDFVYIEE